MERKVELGRIYKRQSDDYYIVIMDIARMHGNPSVSMIIYRNLSTWEVWTVDESTFLNGNYGQDLYEPVESNEFPKVIRNTICCIVEGYVSSDTHVIKSDHFNDMWRVIMYKINGIIDKWNALLGDTVSIPKLSLAYSNDLHSMHMINRVFKKYDVPYIITYSNIIDAFYKFDCIRLYHGTSEKEFIEDAVLDIINIYDKLFNDVNTGVVHKGFFNMFTSIMYEIALTFDKKVESRDDTDTILWCYNYVKSFLDPNKLPIAMSSNTIYNMILNNFMDLIYLLDKITGSAFVKSSIISATANIAKLSDDYITNGDIISVYFSNILNNSTRNDVSLTINNSIVLIDIFKLYGISIDMKYSTSDEIVAYINTLVLDNIGKQKFHARSATHTNEYIYISENQAEDSAQYKNIMDKLDSILRSTGINV